MENNKQNAYDKSELFKQVENFAGLNPDEAVSMFADSDCATEHLTDVAAALKRDIFSESVTIAASIQVEGAKSFETEIKRAAECGHKRLHMKLSGDIDKDREAVSSAAKQFDEDHCGCIELGAQSFDAGLNDLHELGAELCFANISAGFERGDVQNSFANVKAAGYKLIGLDIELSGDPAAALRQTLELCAESEGQPDKLYIAGIRVCPASNTDKAALIRFCALLAISLPFAKIGIELGTTNDVVDFAKAGVSLVYLSGEAINALDDVVKRLTDAHILSGLCAACVACDRYSGEYADLCADKQLYNYCYLNSLISLREFVADHASRETRIAATDLILNRLYGIGNKQIRDQLALAMKQIRGGERGFRF